MVPRSDVIKLDMSVDAALKYIVSMGVVVPAERRAHKSSLALPHEPDVEASAPRDEQT